MNYVPGRMGEIHLVHSDGKGGGSSGGGFPANRRCTLLAHRGHAAPAAVMPSVSEPNGSVAGPTAAGGPEQPRGRWAARLPDCVLAHGAVRASIEAPAAARRGPTEELDLPGEAWRRLQGLPDSRTACETLRNGYRVIAVCQEARGV